MPDNDGEIVIPVPSGDEDELMTAIDLSPNIANMVMTETAGNIQSANQAGRDGATLANNILQQKAAADAFKLGTLEGKAVSGVTATPVASPAVKQ